MLGCVFSFCFILPEAMPSPILEIIIEPPEWGLKSGWTVNAASTLNFQILSPSYLKTRCKCVVHARYRTNILPFYQSLGLGFLALSANTQTTGTPYGLDQVQTKIPFATTLWNISHFYFFNKVTQPLSNKSNAAGVAPLSVSLNLWPGLNYILHMAVLTHVSDTLFQKV